MFCVWSPWTHCKRVSAGERQRATGPGKTSDHLTVNQQTVKIGVVGMIAAVIRGEVGGELTEIILDSGSSVLVWQEMVAQLKSVKINTATLQVQLVTASGSPCRFWIKSGLRYTLVSCICTMMSHPGSGTHW